MKKLFLLLILFALVVPVEAQDTFPVTIEHKFGSTTITEVPERIVSIGFTDHDALLALGVKPVAVRYWYGEAPNAIFEWAQDDADGAEPQVLDMPFGGLNYEAILALQPDLIIAVGAGITHEEYDLLTQIAPTVAQSGDYIDFGMPWQETTRMIGQAVGKTEEAEKLVSELEAKFAEAREQNPSFADKTVAVAYNYGEARTYGFYTSQDSRGRFFTDLGFVVPDELVEIAGENFYADLSAERIDLLDQDLLVFLGLQFSVGGREAIETDPLISQLNVVGEGRVAYVPAEYDDALQFSTVLSLDYALDGILPELQAVFGTETTTTCEDGARLIVHAAGETCVPDNIERVVALEWSYVENVLALGMQPVGIADIEGYKSWVKIPLELDASVVDVGTRQEPNLEAIAALDPDLIITSISRATENHDELSAIAPTLIFDAYPVDGTTHYEEMVNTFTIMGEALSRQTEAEAVLDAMNSYFETAQAALEAAGRGGETFILSQTFLSSEVPTFRLFTDNALAVHVIEQIGLENAWDDAPQQYGFSTVDFEAFADIEDTNFFYIAQDDYQPTLTASPLWNGLPFVQSERDYWMGGDVWLFGGPLSMEVLVDTVLATMGVEISE